MKVLIVKYLEVWGQSLQDDQGSIPKRILQTLNSHTNDEVKYCWEWQLIQKALAKECVNQVKASIVNSSVTPLTETHHVICPKVVNAPLTHLTWLYCTEG